MGPKKEHGDHDVLGEARTHIDDAFGKMGSNLAARRRAKHGDRDHDRPRRDLDKDY